MENVAYIAPPEPVLCIFSNLLFPSIVRVVPAKWMKASVPLNPDAVTVVRVSVEAATEMGQVLCVVASDEVIVIEVRVSEPPADMEMMRLLPSRAAVSLIVKLERVSEPVEVK